MFVFVYGTLKRGYGNNRLLTRSTFVSEGVVRNHRLYNSGFPVATPSEGDSITGEVWDIGDSKDTLENLDSLEGCYGTEDDHGMYYRSTVMAHTESGSIECGMYVGCTYFWRDFAGMKECPNENRLYTWSR